MFIFHHHDTMKNEYLYSLFWIFANKIYNKSITKLERFTNYSDSQFLTFLSQIFEMTLKDFEKYFGCGTLF